ncbi:uncharacterized protein [Linepithema humile]|uniref:uncharacterized protein n=1 Tax=Linepithema humile TaxID=83485 RepID=UPI0006230EC6|nr:PREDICTED: uncharacterized protein LOC105675570 [Linepithema humile]
MFANSTLCALCLITLFLNINVAEWVDMPQFSDEKKIYRIPSVQYDQFYKIKRGDADGASFPDDQQNGSETYHRPVKVTYVMDDKKTEIQKINSISVPTTPANLFRDQIVDSFTEFHKNHAVTNIDAVTENKLINRYHTTSPTKDTFDIFATQPPSTTTQKQKILQDEYYNDTLKQNDGIFQYLPIDILKSVHDTLQSQPMSFEGKLHFLKMFERTLMAEIETRLATTMAPSRRTRGADHYGHDEGHDDHSIGFPSIEGALMAISFLTFAVYLVRLVMLLFKNMNPMPTTTAATIFVGKRKRSVDLDDDAIRILNNMHTFVSDL